MRIRITIAIVILLAALVAASPAAAQVTPSCAPFTGQVTVGIQGYDFRGDGSFLRQYRSFPDGGVRGNVTDVELFACPDPNQNRKFEFTRRNPYRLVEVNTLRVSLDDFTFRVDLWRYRRTPLEIFPEGTGEGSVFGSLFNNDVPPGTVFRSNRTRFDVEGRLRGSAFGEGRHLQNLWVRYRNEQRSGLEQYAFLLGGGDRVAGFDNVRWRQVALDRAADLNEIHAGVNFGRPGNYLLAIRFTADRFSRESAPFTQQFLSNFGGVTPDGSPRIRVDGTLGLRTVGWVPDSRLLAPAVEFLKGWREDSQMVLASYTFSRLDQRTLSPLQEILSAGFRGRVNRHTTNVASLHELGARADLRLFFRDTIRDNETSFGPGQFLDPAANLAAPRLNRLHRVRYGGELTYRPATRSALSAEFAQLHTRRDLDFAAPTSGIGPDVTLLERDTDLTTLRFRARTRPTRNTSLRGEYRFQTAQKTGLPTEPDIAHRVQFESSYQFSGRAVLGGVSFHFLENRESNDKLIFTGVLAGVPQDSFPQDFQNNQRYFDLTFWLVPGETPVTFTVSAHRYRDESEQGFFTTNRRRFETAAGVFFTLRERIPYRNTTNAATVGVNYQLGEKWEVHSNYVLSQSTGAINGSGALAATLHPFSLVANRLQQTLGGLSYDAPRQFRLTFEFAHDNYDDRADRSFSGSLNSFFFGLRKSF